MGNGLNPCKQQDPSSLYEPLINTPILEEAENENLRVFSVTELKKATNEFSKERVVKGDDGSVRTFYKGKGYIDDTTFETSRTKTGIAVSVMGCLQDSSQACRAWKEKVEFLGKFSHPNLVKFYGYCCEANRTLLVFEYLHKGSLDHHIFGKEEALPWETRVKIAIGTAQGIVFLHSIKKSPVHQELRMHNIMLDEKLIPRFGFSSAIQCTFFYLESNKQCLEDETFVRTTPTYTPPAYIMTGRLVMKDDVYTFGVILLELLTGSKDIAKRLITQSLDVRTRPFFIGEIIDPRLGNDYPMSAAIQMGKLIQSCTKWDNKKRPLMQQVLDVLNNIAEITY